MKKKPAKQITNRRARHDYELDDTFVVGIALSGAETKSLRLGHGQLVGSFVNIKDGELWLINAVISGTSAIHIAESDQTKSRKLLAKRKEIDELINVKNQGNNIIPLEFLTGGRYIKLRIAIGKGKKKYDKRQTLKKRDETLQINTALKQRGKR